MIYNTSNIFLAIFWSIQSPLQTFEETLGNWEIASTNCLLFYADILVSGVFVAANNGKTLWEYYNWITLHNKSY